MIEASLFYEARSEGLGLEFLDGVQRVIDTLREQPQLGRSVGVISGEQCCAFPILSDLF